MKNIRSLLSGAWVILAFWYLFYLLPGSTGKVVVFAGTGFLFSAWIAVMLIARHSWSAWAITVATTIMNIMALAFVFGIPLEGGLSMLLGVVTVIYVWNKKSGLELRPATGLRQDARSFILVFLGVLFVAAVLGFGISEGNNIQMSFKKARLESQCTDPKVDIDACRRLGVLQVDSPMDENEMRAGRDLLEAMCKNDDPVGCRRALMARMSWQFDLMTYRDLSKELWTRCQSEGGTACLALTLDDRVRPRELAKVAKSKCSKSDLDACVAWAVASNDDHDHAQNTTHTKACINEQNDAHTKACELGIVGSCSFSGVSSEAREKACSHTKDPWTCFAADKSEKHCDSGVWPACDLAAWPEKNWGEINFAKRLVIKPAELNPAWERLVAGRESIRKSNFLWRPTPMPLAEIDQTFGAACEAGIAYGCTEGANAATNVQLEFRTQERIDHAQKSLNKGCKNGDYLACWQLLSIAKLSPEQTVEYAREACYTAPRGVREYPQLCETYVHLWMAKNGITPWLMDSTLAEPDMIDTCAKQKDRYACDAISGIIIFGINIPEPIDMPQHVVAWDASSVACEQYVDTGCTQLVRIARDWPTESEESAQDVSKKVCAKIPEFCEMADQVASSIP